MNDYQLVCRPNSSFKRSEAIRLLVANGHTTESANQWLSDYMIEIPNDRVIYISESMDTWKYRDPESVKIRIQNHRSIDRFLILTIGYFAPVLNCHYGHSRVIDRTNEI